MTPETSTAGLLETLPTHADVAARAYEIWLARGGSHGHHEDDWRQAEEDVRRRAQSAARPALEYSVLLSCVGDNKIGVIRELRAAMGLELAAAKALVDRVPQSLNEVASLADAEHIQQRLAAVGATVEVVRRS